MNIHNIDESQFQKIDSIRQIIVHDHARRFASINLHNLGECGLSWRSDLIEPMVMFSPDESTIWIGVDQQLVAIDLNQGRISVALPLNSSVVQILVVSLITVVLTELEVLLFNSDNSIRCIQGLPNIGLEISIQGKDLSIGLLDGDVLILSIATENFQETAMSV